MLINNIWILEQHVICGIIQYFCYAVSILIIVPFLICAMNHAIVDVGKRCALDLLWIFIYQISNFLVDMEVDWCNGVVIGIDINSHDHNRK